MNALTESNADGRNAGTESDPYRALLLALVDGDPDFVSGVAVALAGTDDDDDRDGVRGHVCGPLCGRPFGADVSPDLDVLRARPAAPVGGAHRAATPPVKRRPLDVFRCVCGRFSHSGPCFTIAMP